MSQPAPLNPLRLPLHGSRLIEASAGTGKTFTIALLYVRLVLGGHSVDDDTAFIRPLTPPEILVVTFTNAATQELRERIRNRLVEAAEVFRETPDAKEAGHEEGLLPWPENVPDDAGIPAVHGGQMAKVAPKDGFTAPSQWPASVPPAHDPLLVQLRDQYDPATWPACSRRLALAAEWMDEAAVSTIHSWCYRMLREHAFDSGSLFSLNLENDQRELEHEVVRDYWRSFYYPLDSDALGIVTRYWKSPDDLHALLQRLLPESEALGGAKPQPRETLAATQAERSAQLSELKAPWPAWLNELVPALEDAATRKAFKGQSFNAKSRANWLGALREWSESDADRPALTDAAWKRMTPDGMADIWKEGAPPSPQVWEALAQLPAALDALPEPRNDLLIHAVQWCRARLEREQERRAEMGPNDLLTHLDRALQGPNKEALAAQIQRQFPVALIDEFQDTDPVQYRIFNAVYDVATPRRDIAILLIGDPKQAIYAFRGADIFTYLQARHDTDGRHVTLGTNFRSSRAMVAAVNHCFSYADQHDAGAFLFPLDDGGNPLPFQPVDAKGTSNTLVLNGQPLPAMTLWPLESDEPLSKTAYQTEMAERCASHMAALLEAGRKQKAGFAKAVDNSATGDSSVRSGEQSLTPLAPSDMAVLVNGLQEARAIRLALASRGIKSVYLSDHDKVFSSPVAPQLAIWLRACAEPQANSRQAETKLRAALATPVIGLSLEELDHLNQSELAWEARVEQFSDYHRLWQRQGVLPLVRRLMVDFDIAARLLSEFAEGERLLTDLLHLGEMLQHASQELDGEHALIRFLAEAIVDPDSHGDSHKLRLESDADLVKVVTIHKSKGLEYPLVFLPFIANHRPVSDSDIPLRWHDSDGRLQLSLSADEETLATADRERLGEDLRKLYVALTRARHATWLGLAPLKGSENSAIGHLINGGKAIAPSAFTQALSELVAGSNIELSAAPEPTALRFTPAPEQQALGHARTPLRAAREQWWIASYSALRTSGAITPLMPTPEPTTPQEATTLEVLDEPHDNAINTEAFHLHRFPRGPGPGTFLHGLLEWAGQLGFQHALDDPAAREDLLRRRVQLRGWQTWHDTLAGWFEELLAIPLPLPTSQPGHGGHVALSELKSYQVELEFWFAAHHVGTRKLDELVSDHLLPGVSRPALDADTLNGMLKGFIDLAFEHEGRFYVLDWKSNYLGSDDSAYTADALRNAMLEKRYDLQAALYLLALHRLLKARLPDYDPHQHLGGSMTVFLRGSRTAARGVHAVPAPVALIEALDHLFAGTAADTAATHQEAVV
ncbi:exodeoxyribonuclease V subunit beta [Vreelandella profundi]|uniref:exodeoxyribonuclease V subunit beta n=1 Tax=Vreelandella profundi TaxID=2852117 RepID=UPI001F01B949|nr:exodeoxyribonuclease V subunit beta [Halomonas profundi]